MPPLIWLLPNFIARVIPIKSGARGKASRQFQAGTALRRFLSSLATIDRPLYLRTKGIWRTWRLWKHGAKLSHSLSSEPKVARPMVWWLTLAPLGSTRKIAGETR